MSIQYTGEHIFAGTLGTTFIWISFLSILISLVIYLITVRNDKKHTVLIKAGDSLFFLHFLSLLASVFTLYHLIFNHYFEYSYVWQYTSRDLHSKFLISSLWAGQEGSFLTWAVFQGILGIILIFRAKEWKKWVMPAYLFGQFFLIYMVLGVELAGVKIGSSPFSLLRLMPQNIGAEIFQNPNYLTMITDGNGLNPLLENYWMVIHPPALFLGYAVCLIPFSYAIGSLMRRQYHSWLKPALPWILAAILTLGIGILLGGRWAYESLTFGGFWAWDPVENASLVPWLFGIAALHMMLIAKKRYHSYSTAYLFVFLTWIFVIYATYLTRSGVLGETSVHAFGDSGMALSMLIFNAVFLLVSFILLLFRRGQFPRKDSDEIMSREFWMFLGSVVVALSSFQVIITTSIPVINKVIGSNIAPPVDNVRFYNTWQLPFGLLIVFLITISQYLTYGKNAIAGFLKKLLVNGIITLIITVIIALLDHVRGFDRLLFLYFVVFAALVSISYVIRFLRKTNNLGSAITHAGFAIFLLGVILAFSNSQIISRNSSGLDLGDAKANEENLVLMKDVTQQMGNYLVTYTNREDKGRETFFQVDFVNKNDIDGKIEFSVFPSVNHNARMGNVYNPDTRHMLTRDIYTFISYTQQSMGKIDSTGFVQAGVEKMNLHDTLFFARSFIILDSMIVNMKGEDINNASLTARFKIKSMKAGMMERDIKYNIMDGSLIREDAVIEPLNLRLRFEGVSTDSQEIMVGLYEKQEDYIVLKAIIFPFMNVLWAGAFIMFAGLVYAIIQRMRVKPASMEDSASAINN